MHLSKVDVYVGNIELRDKEEWGLFLANLETEEAFTPAVELCIIDEARQLNISAAKDACQHTPDRRRWIVRANRDCEYEVLPLLVYEIDFQAWAGDHYITVNDELASARRTAISVRYVCILNVERADDNRLNEKTNMSFVILIKKTRLE